MKTVVATLACVFLLGSLALAAEPMKLVYYESFRPYSWTEDGETRGLLIDVLSEALEKRMGIALEHRGYPWERAQALVQRGQADGFSTVPTPQRLEYALPSQETVVPVTFSLFILPGNPRSQELRAVRRVAELKGFRIGHYTGSGWAKANLGDMDVHWVPEMENVLAMVAGGRVDAFADVTLSVRHYVRQMGLAETIEELPTPIDSIDFKLFVGKLSAFRDILPEFDETMRRMREDGTLDTIYLNYGLDPAGLQAAD